MLLDQANAPGLSVKNRTVFDHLFVDEPTAIIQKRMHTSGVISWYYIRSTLAAIPQVICTCTKCRLYSFRLSNVADVANVTH